MTDKHLSSQFDSELNAVSSRLMAFGGLVETQIRDALKALAQFSVSAADSVIAAGDAVNAMEIEIDHALSSIIARRQPAARDLRLLIVISKTTANLERAGDEAEKIARMVKSIVAAHAAATLPAANLAVAAELAATSLRKSLDCLARLDIKAAVNILRDDAKIDHEFARFIEIMVTNMMADPKNVAPGLDLVFIAKAIERIGDHAKNIAEFTIYLAAGQDIRHAPVEDIESTLQDTDKAPIS